MQSSTQRPQRFTGQEFDESPLNRDILIVFVRTFPVKTFEGYRNPQIRRSCYRRQPGGSPDVAGSRRRQHRGAPSARLHGRIETLQAATRDNGGHVRLVFREVQFPDGRRAEAWITNSFAAPPPRRGLKYGLLMGAGAVAGALVGGESARVAGILGGLLAGFVLAGDPHPDRLPGVTLKAGKRIDLLFHEDLVLH